MNALILLKQDHNNVDALFTRFEELGEQPSPEKEQIRDKVVEHLSIHAAIEEQLFYPAVREAAPDVEAWVLEGLEEHHVVKWTLSELQKMPVSAERFDAKMKVLIEAVRHHATEEEEEIFPKVRDAMTNEALEALGEALQEAKATAPTKAHPRTPDTPPLNILVGLPVAILDRVFDTGRETVAKVIDLTTSAVRNRSKDQETVGR
ncbi:MAG TPA: hemerythrin domain-containing protein [Acidimicrobiales bacterium]|nr:hemerythrin domain-containing protein [Acidimicrobiales bacterium]